MNSTSGKTDGQQNFIFLDNHETPSVSGFEPFYTTNLGAAIQADSLDVLQAMPNESVDLVVTSPPYALHYKKAYGNRSKAEYNDWFIPFAEEIRRVLKNDGSFVLNIGGSYNKGKPTRSLYHFKLLIRLVEEVGFHLAQECFWYNPAKMPAPAEWVNVRRIRIRDSVEYIWWLSKTPWPKAFNKKVLRPYSKDMKRLNEKGIEDTERPSGHTIKSSFADMEAGGSIPPNVIGKHLPKQILEFGNNAANDAYNKGCKKAGIKRHPARFPIYLPEFFIRFLTDEGDLVVDPFAGSNTTGAAAEKLDRHWIAVDNVQSYLEGSKFRFSSVQMHQ